MNKIRNSIKKMMALIVVFAVLFGTLPTFTMTAAAAERQTMGTKISDLSTINGWKSFFGDPNDADSKISTENAGAVWNDKSVFTSATAFAGTSGTAVSLNDANNNFLVALSAMASNSTVKGHSTIPTDTIFVLDVSGSMVDSNVDDDLVEAANESITTLLSANIHNRVGVVLYSGSSNSNTNSDASLVMLPLGRYTTASDNEYLAYDDGGWFGTPEISISSNVRYEGTNTRPTSVRKNITGATYIQKGIISAMNEFIDEDNQTTVTDVALGTLNRMPIMVLMSDGAATLASNNFTNPGQYTFDNGGNSTAGEAFATQLSASYAKKQIEKKYGTDSYFYTLGLAVGNSSLATSVLDPKNANASADVNAYWALYNEAQSSITLESNVITKISEKLDQNYVDKHFSVGNNSSDLATGLKDAFEKIVGAINLQSVYHPTLVEGSANLSGYISFVDRIGKYMDVADVKGILINNELHTGELLAKHFVTGGGDLGTSSNPKPLGTELVHSVQQRLGIENVEAAQALIRQAYQKGQLSYTGPGQFSNYIGWYANAKGEYLGFYHEGETVLPSATGNQDTDPVFTIKSYGYLGETDEIYGVHDSDMMYATVQVRHNIKTGEEMVTFAVPASLIPTITYNVELDENDNLKSIDFDQYSAKHPIRLVYEVGLSEEITPIKLSNPDSELAEYINNNTEDGKVNFYTNQYDVENKTGNNTVNTYVYFRPSRQNEKYYYTKNAVVYADTNGTVYNSAAKPTGTKYRAYTVYEKDGSAYNTKTIYRKITQDVIVTATDSNNDGVWEIPSGSIHTNLDGYTVYKEQNNTKTLTETFGDNDASNDKGIVNKPFVDTNQVGGANNSDYDYVVGSTLGNNGKFSIVPETAVKITKTVTETVTGATDYFMFNVECADEQNADRNTILVDANGNQSAGSISFNSQGVASVTLKDGETVYIIGLTAGRVYTVTEQENNYYNVESVNGNTSEKSAILTTVAGKTVSADFVNTPAKKGNLTIYKTVTHDMGTAFSYDKDTEFEIEVDLNGEGTANKSFNVVYTGSSTNNTNPVTTDENGKFKIYLKNNEQFEIVGLPVGTTANGTELYNGNPYTQGGQWYAGFDAPQYWDSDVNPDDDVVTVAENTTVTAGVVNHYNPQEVEVNLALSGEKTVDSSWPSGEEFTFELQEPDGNGWKTIKTDTATESEPKISFEHSLTFDKVGEYSYQVVEVKGNNNNVIYDQTKHNFTVVVTDADFNGELEAKVVSAHTGAEFTKNGNTYSNSNINFTNYYDKQPAIAYIDIQKVLDDKIASSAVSEHGFSFKIYSDESKQTEVAKTEGHTDAMGEAQIVLPIIDDVNSLTVGEHSYVYYLSEDNKYMGSNLEGMKYSKDIKVTVVIDKKSDGTFTTSVKSAVLLDVNDTNVLQSNGEIRVSNEYDLAPAEVEFDVRKTIDGRNFVIDDEFKFELKQVDTSTAPEIIFSTPRVVTTNEQKVDFGKISFKKVGDYNFEIREIEGADNIGITYDKTVYYVKVSITDNLSGALQKHIEVYTLPGTQMTFKNVYHAQSAELVINAKKTLLGRNIRQGEFGFTLTQVADANGTAMNNPLSRTAFVGADGKIAFEKIEYTAEGIYYYQIKEIVGTLGGVDYDQSSHIVTVNVVDNKKGKLVATADKNVADANNTNIVFANTYTASTKAILEGEKYLLGGTLKDNQYTFVLYDSQNVEIDRQTNVDGKFRFEIDYTEADIGKTYNYTVKEIKGGEYEIFENSGDHYGINYDERQYDISIAVNDNLNGTLSTNAVITNSSTQNTVDKLVFVNKFNNIAVKKVIDETTPDISVDGKSVSVGDILDYQISYYCGNGSSDVTITDTIPEGTVYVENSASDGGIYSNGVITWSFDNVLAGETKSVTFKVQVVEGDKDITNKAVVIDGQNTYETNEIKNFTYKKTVTKQQAKNGEEIEYSIFYRNKTNSETVVTITDVLDERLQYVEGSATLGGVYNDGKVVWTFTVPADENVKVSFKAKIKAEAEGMVENTATVLENGVEYTTNTVKTEIIPPEEIGEGGEGSQPEPNPEPEEEPQIEEEPENVSQEKPKPKPENKPMNEHKSPQTGDNTNFIMLLALLFVSTVGISASLYYFGKSKN